MIKCAKCYGFEFYKCRDCGRNRSEVFCAYRKSGKIICTGCEENYYQHPDVVSIRRQCEVCGLNTACTIEERDYSL